MGYILVIDDDVPLCELLEILLTEEGYEVRCAGSATDAIALIQQQQPNVILCDMSLGGESGDEFVRRYRELPDATARLIIVSGIGNLEQAAGRLGADGFILKPFDLDEVLSMVESVVDRP